jgi:hypothetical protein
MVSELTVEAHVREVAAAEFVREDSVNDGIRKPPMWSSLMTRSQRLVLQLRFP